MSDVTTDDKIARLVHLVLEAVDHRLADIRVELQQIDARLTRLEQAPAQSAGQPARADDERFERLRAEIDRVRHLVESLAARPAPSPPVSTPSPSPAALDTTLPSLPSLSTVATPLRPTEPSFHGAPEPLVAAADAASAAPPTDTSELIDLDRLSDLLSARLGQLNLPRPG